MVDFIFFSNLKFIIINQIAEILYHNKLNFINTFNSGDFLD